MLAYCTYCSAEKNYTEIPITAIQLYDSIRITKVFKIAKESKVAFLILSGKFGLIEPDKEISYYDHLLSSSEIENHSDLISSQISSKNITKIEFYTNNIDRDKNIQAYIDCISKACAKSLIQLKIVTKDFSD